MPIITTNMTLPDWPACLSACEVNQPCDHDLRGAAINDITANIVSFDSIEYFGAGADFGPTVYTRDIAIAGVLALARYFPRQLVDSLKYSRVIRRRLGWRSPSAYVVKEFKAPWKVETGNASDFKRRHRTNNFMRRTDDVVWLWPAGELMHQGRLDPAWVYQEGVACFEELYSPLYDATTGLYRGQCCFVDIHFEDHRASGYPQEWTIGDCLLIRPTSTNALYVEAMRVLSESAACLGLTKASEEWNHRADKLCRAMCAQLRHPDGTFASYLDPRGARCLQRDALGTALAVLLDVVAGEDARLAVAGYPMAEHGIPLFTPFFEDVNTVYHNQSAWPFVEFFFLRALRKATRLATTKGSVALMRRSFFEGSFREYVDFRTGMASGSHQQLWTAAAYLAASDDDAQEGTDSRRT